MSQEPPRFFILNAAYLLASDLAIDISTKDISTKV